MRRSLPLVVALIVVMSACGGSKTPTQPHIPSATLVSRGNMTFACSFSGCSFEGEAVNNGQGCASNVRGISRLMNTAGTEVGRADWTLAATRRIKSGETFLYSGCCFTQSAVSTPGTYKTEITWDNVSGC